MPKREVVKTVEHYIAKGETPTPKVLETFRKYYDSTLANLSQKEPDCFNGVVSIVKYRISVEAIVEPIEEYHKRLQDLWDECDNHHHVDPLKQMAKLFGYELVGSYGSKRKEKKQW